MDASMCKWVLLLLAFGLCVERGYAERPVLDLFGNGEDIATVEVLVDTADFSVTNLVLNEDTENLVTDSDEDIQYVIAKLNGGGSVESENLMLDTSMLDISAVFIDVREDGEIRISIGGDSFNASATNYSAVLELLEYRSNLTSVALSDPQRNVTITAYDEVGPSNTQTALIQLRVPNQDAPVFTSNASYSVSLEENSPVGTEINVVSATDPEGRAVTYSLLENDDAFAIATESGVVTVTDSDALNYEDRRSFELTIVASDQDPFSALASEATLTIALTNVNDNDPVFDPDSYDADVPENVQGAFVVALTATDADGDSLEYIFAVSGTESTFQLDSATGEVTVRDMLDYETTTTYTFDVLVTDGDRSDTASVEVHVTDVADGRPVVLPLRKTILLNLDEG